MEMKQSEFDLGLDKIKDNFKVLEMSAGWKNLTERQQRIIKMSLYVQSRAERTSDPLSAFGFIEDIDRGRPVTVMKKEYTLEKPDRKYRLSQNFVSEWYCHYAIKALETNKLPDQIYNLGEDFFDGDYQHDTKDNKIENRIKVFGYPCVVQITRGENEEQRTFNRLHSCLVLGEINGQLLVWEKVNGNEPFAVTTLEVVKSMFNESENYWGIRKLKRP